MSIIVQQPDSLSFSQNLRKLIISSAETVSLKLYKGEEQILDEFYQPDTNNLIEVDLHTIVDSALSVSLPCNGLITEQIAGIADFVANVDGNEIAFRVIKGGVSGLQEMAESFTNNHFLSWQVQDKRVLQHQPEWLTVFTNATRNLKAKAYYQDNSNASMLLASLDPGKLLSVDVSWASINAQFEKKNPIAWDVWFEDDDGTRLSFVQRYCLRNPEEDENIFIWANTLGGIDTISLMGSAEEDQKLEHQVAEMGDESLLEYQTNKNREVKQSTGYLTCEESRWIEDFFYSQRRYMLDNEGSLKTIVLTGSKIVSSTADDLFDYEFTYRFASENQLLNLQRSFDPLPALEVPADFFLTELLSGLPVAQYSDSLLLAVQSPFAQAWQRLSMAQLWGSALHDLVDGSTISVVNGKLQVHGISGGIGAASWTDLQNKPFNALSGHFAINQDGLLSLASNYALIHNHPYLSDIDPQITNWNNAFGWGNHATVGYALGHTHPYRPDTWNPGWGEVTAKPTWTEKIGWNGNAVTVSTDLHISGKLIVDDTIMFFGLGAGGGSGTGASLLWQLSDVADDVANAVYGDLIIYNGTHFSRINQSAFSQLHTHPYLSDSDIRIAQWSAAYSWGNHALSGYAVAHAHPYLSDSDVRITNWNAAFSWGDHAKMGYAIAHSHPYLSDSDARIANWTAAYSWGNHAGLYRAAGWVPSWGDLTGMPTWTAKMGWNETAVTIASDLHITGKLIVDDTIQFFGVGVGGSGGGGASALWQLSDVADDVANAVYGDLIMYNGTHFARMNQSALTHPHPYLSDSDARIGNWDTAYTHSQSAHYTGADIYAWAKAATKPAYIYSEIGGSVPTWNQDTNGSAGRLSVPDLRDVLTTPNTYTTPQARFEFKSNAAAGLSDGGNFVGLFSFRKYGGTLTDWTGGRANQLGFTDANNLWIRTGDNNTWDAWQKFYHSGNFNKSDVPVNGSTGTFAGTVSTGAINISGITSVNSKLGSTSYVGNTYQEANDMVFYVPTGAGYFSNIRWAGGGGAGEAFFGVSQETGVTSGQLGFFWKTYNGSSYGERMRLTTNGNLSVTGTVTAPAFTGTASNASAIGGVGLVSVMASKGTWVSNSNMNNIIEVGTYVNVTGNGTGNSNWPFGYGVLNVFGNGSIYGGVQHHYTADGAQQVRINWGGGFVSNWRTVYDTGNFNPANYSLTTHAHNFTTAEYIGGGTELPSYFGGNRLKLNMLSVAGIGWADCLWMSGYGGGDVPESNQLVMGKQSEFIGFRKQNFNSNTWGTLRAIWHEGNLNRSDTAFTASTGTFSSLRVNQTAGSGAGLSLYGSTDYTQSYGIWAGLSSSWGNYGAVTSDWNIYFACSGADSRGFIFRNGSAGTNVASINLVGTATYAGGVYSHNTTTGFDSDGSSLYLKSGANTYLNTANSAYVTSSGQVTTPAGNSTQWNNQWKQSSRDFADGTLIQTGLWYNDYSGDAFLLEIKGNSYTTGCPFNVMVQGYMYANTIINVGAIANGMNISGLIAFNLGGYLHFWFPRHGYWQGFDVYCSAVTSAGAKVNSVVAISNSVVPAGRTKEVSLSPSIAQNWHSQNFTPSNYLPIVSSNNIKIGDTINLGNDSSIATTAARGVFFHTSNDGSYAIYKPYGVWTQPLHIGFYTGIKIGGHFNYGGIKFYSSPDMANEMMSIANGDGNVRITNNLYVNGTIQFYTASDRRLKKDFEAITNPIEKIKSLTGYFFNYNDDGMKLGGYAKRRDIGLIAQDVGKILPEACGKLWGTEYLGYKAEKLIPLLVEAIKQQQGQIDKLTRQLNG